MQQNLDSTRVSLANAFDTLADNARRQQHLYSATIAVLIALVVFAGFVLAALETDKHLSQQQSQVAGYVAAVSQRLGSEAAFLRRSVLSVRRYDERGATQAPDSAAIRAVRATGVARISDKSAGHDYYLLATTATQRAWGAAMPTQLARLQQIALGILATQQAFGLDHWVYAMALENDSGAILARQPSAAQTTVPIRPALINTLRDTVTHALLDRTGHAVPPAGEQVWAGPVRDPLTGTMVMLSVGAAYSGDTATVLLAACVPARDFLAQLERPGDSALLGLLTPAGERIDVAAPVLPADSPAQSTTDSPVISAILAQARRQPRGTSHHTRRGVLIVQPLQPGFGALLCFLPYGLLVPALAPALAVIVGVGLLLIGAIVLTARYWDRQLLRRTHTEAARALENEILNQILVSATPVGLCIVRQRDYLVLTSNQLAQTLLRLDEAETLPTQVTEAFERQPLCTEAGQLAPITRFTVPAPPAPDDDASVQRYLQVTYAPARYRDDKVLFCAVQDVTTQQALEQQLRSAQLATEAMLRARSSFFAAMSHEIRTPLNALIGNLELLARSPGLESHAHRLQALGSAADGLRRIVNDILDFSKIDAGKLQLVNKPFRLAEALEGLALTYAPMATGRSIQLSLQLAPGLGQEVNGDRMRLMQVVNNLLNNAFKFTTSGRITLSGSYGPDTQGRHTLTCRVSDSGSGMPPALIERVFQPFVQGDAVATSRYGGTGLGLSICARLCELMGGSIAVQSVQDVGSAFTIAVPLPPAGDAAGQRDGAEPRGQDRRMPGGLAGKRRLANPCAGLAGGRARAPGKPPSSGDRDHGGIPSGRFLDTACTERRARDLDDAGRSPPAPAMRAGHLRADQLQPRRPAVLRGIRRGGPAGRPRAAVHGRRRGPGRRDGNIAIVVAIAVALTRCGRADHPRRRRQSAEPDADQRTTARARLPADRHRQRQAGAGGRRVDRCRCRADRYPHARHERLRAARCTASLAPRPSGAGVQRACPAGAGRGLAAARLQRLHHETRVTA